MTPLPPPIHDWPHFRTLRFQAPVWEPIVRAVLDRHRLPRPATIALASSVHVVAMAGEVTVKLYQPLNPGAFEIESTVLPLLGAAGLPVPRLLATGTLRDGASAWPWPYCVMSTMPGVPLDQVEGDLSGIAASLGRFLRAMHAVRPAGERLSAPGFLAHRLAVCGAEHRRRAALPAHLLAGLDAFLDRARPLVLDGRRGAALTHGDLHDGNVHADATCVPPRLAGVIDFNDVRVTDPHYDLVVVHLRALRTDRRLLRALLDAYGWGPRGDGWAPRMMALTVAHDFDELGELLARRPELAGAASLEELALRVWG